MIRRPTLVALLAALTLVAGPSAAEEAPAEPGPVQRPVSADGLVANLFHPDGKTRRPAVVLVGGSGGGIGWQDHMGDLLAREGFAALAVAYFGMEGLPAELELIPLEYFDRALTWLERQPTVDPDRIGIAGVSKGGELALLLASRDKRLRAVVAFVPSSVVFQSIADQWPRTSSWSLDGKGLPFVPYRITENFRPDNLAAMYRESLDQAEAAQAVIPVERIAGPVLLLSGESDRLWPSAQMSEQVIRRLREHKHPHPAEHVAYADAGHLISRIRSDDVTRLGGTAEGNAAAQVDAQKRAIAFLRRHLQ